ncbi:MAG: glycosyltransferase [Betaproteobacteria bacterium]
MISITHIITGLNVGGAERALHSLLTGGLEGRVSNCVISLMDEGHYGPLLRQAGVKVHCLGMKRGLPTPAVFGRLHSALREARPDVVQGWMYHGNIAASVAKWLAPTKPAIFWNVRTSMDDPSVFGRSTQMFIRLGAWLSSDADAIVYNSERSRKQHGQLGFSSERDTVIPNGFDPELWHHGTDARRQARATLGLDANVPVVGFVGRGATVKDVPTLMRAFTRLRARIPAAQLICIGRDIEAYCPSDISTDGVRFMGQRSDVTRLYAAFDVSCLSSRVEGFPNAIGEAMACGVPCVTTDVGDAAEVVGETGWVVPQGDPAVFAEALEAALREPAEVHALRGLDAQRRIKERFDLATIITRYENLYCSTRSPI